MIKLLHIIPTLDRSGAEKQLALLAAGLPREEFEVHVCALTRGGPYEADLRDAGVPVTVVGKVLKFDPVALGRLARLVRRLRPDVVHTWMFTANSYGRVAARWAGVPKLVASERNADRWKTWLHRQIDLRLARDTDCIVANSAGAAAFYRRLGIPAEKLHVIPNGVARTPRAAADPALLRHELGVPESAHMLGFVGRLAPQKRVKDLIWAADLLKVIRDDVYLLLVGDGPQRDRLEQFARDVRILDRVRFLGHRDDVPELLGAIDVLWLASDFEGMPNVVLEAMAAGVPVVATGIPGTNEVVVDGETGFLVPVGDRAAFARQTRKLLEDPQLAARMGEAGRRRAAEHFSIEAMIEAHARLYRELIHQDRAKGSLSPRDPSRPLAVAPSKQSTPQASAWVPDRPTR